MKNASHSLPEGSTSLLSDQVFIDSIVRSIVFYDEHLMRALVRAVQKVVRNARTPVSPLHELLGGLAPVDVPWFWFEVTIRDRAGQETKARVQAENEIWACIRVNPEDERLLRNRDAYLPRVKLFERQVVDVVCLSREQVEP